jgi:hypothetical protein
VVNPTIRRQYYELHRKIPKRLHGIDVNPSARRTNILQEILVDKKRLYCKIHDPQQQITSCSCLNNFYTSGYTDNDISLFPNNIGEKTQKTKNTAIAEKEEDSTPLYETDKSASLGVSSAIPNWESKAKQRADSIFKDYSSTWQQLQTQNPEKYGIDIDINTSNFWSLMGEQLEIDLEKVIQDEKEKAGIKTKTGLTPQNILQKDQEGDSEWYTDTPPPYGDDAYKYSVGGEEFEHEEEAQNKILNENPLLDHGSFRPEKNPNYYNKLWDESLRNNIPMSITLLAACGFREMEQLSYRFIQTQPDQEGNRTVYVWFLIVDNGNINHLITHEGDINYNSIIQTSKYINLYTDLFHSITGETPVAETFNHYSSDIADKEGNSLLPPEREDGPHEYKNAPYVIKDESWPLFEVASEQVNITALPGLRGNQVFDSTTWEEEMEETEDLAEINSVRSEIDKISRMIEDCLDTIELISDSKIHRWTNKDVNKLDPTGQLAKSKGGLYFGFKQEPEEEGISPNTTRFIREFEWDDITLGFKFELEDLNEERIQLEKKLATLKPNKIKQIYDRRREYWKRFETTTKDGKRKFKKPLPYVVRLAFKLHTPGFKVGSIFDKIGKQINLPRDEPVKPTIEIYSEEINEVHQSAIIKTKISPLRTKVSLEKLYGHIPMLVDHYLDLQTARMELQRIVYETTESLITAALMARQPHGVEVKGKIINNFRKLNLKKEDDLATYNYIQYFLEEIQTSYNKLDKHNLDSVTDYADNLISSCKTMSSQMRVAWQKGAIEKTRKEKPRFRRIRLTDLFSWSSIDPAVDMTPLSERTFRFISELSPKYMNETTTVRIEDKKYYCSSFSLGQMGYLGRSLPKPTQRFLDRGAIETYERFKTTKDVHDYDEEMKKYTYQWSKQYFDIQVQKDRKGEFCYKERPNATVSASFERTRSKGGFNTLISDLFKTMSKCSDSELTPWPEIQKHFVKYRNIHEEMLSAGNITKKGQCNQEFLTAAAKDFMSPYINHAKVCKREECESLESHLPMWINTIAELGGKARIPCYTSGFINALAEPIRKKMYLLINMDSRTSFRLKHGDRLTKLKTFLHKFAEEPVSHSGDLTVSTDNFPMWFTEQVIKGMADSGFINEEERLIALTATGPYRCIFPCKENRDDLREIQPRTLEELRFEHFIRDTLEAQRELKETGLLKVTSQKHVRDDTKVIFKNFNKSIPNRTLESHLRDYTRRYEDYVIQEPEMKTYFNQLEGRHTNPFHQFTSEEVSEYNMDIEYFIKGRKRMTTKIFEEIAQDTWFSLYLKSNMGKDNKIKPENLPTPDFLDYAHSISNDIKDCLSPYEKIEVDTGIIPMGAPDKSRIRFIQKGKHPYLTKKGVQMASTISIAMLYSYNIVADTWARDHCNLPHYNVKGALSQLCGDDCLRAGSQEFIDAYRFAISVLGGQFSKTKDVVGRMPRGVFTEFMFEGAEYLPITKVKTVLRPEKEGAPLWKRSIQALNNINSRSAEHRPKRTNPGLTDNIDFGQPKMFSRILQQEIVEKFPQLRRKDSLITLPIPLGGIGELGPPKSDLIEKVLNNILRIKDPFLATKAVKIIRSPLTVVQNVVRHKNLDAEDLLKYSPLVITEYNGKASKLRHRLYHEGKILWLRDISQGLRGKIEIASMLENPPLNQDFEGEKIQIIREKNAIDECYHFLERNGLADYHGANHVEGLRDKPLKLDLFLGSTIYADISTEYLREIEGSNLEEEEKGASPYSTEQP